MKKIFSLLILILLSISLAGCKVSTKNIKVVLKGINEEETIEVNRLGEEITLKTPLKDGYEFKGWFLDKNFTKPVPLQYKVTDNVTLYAKFSQQIKMIEVAYSVNGEIIKRVNYIPNSNIITIKDPSKPNYTFAGWFLDERLTTPLPRDYKVKENMTVFAKFTENVQSSILVQFYCNNTLYSQYTSIINEKLILPKEPLGETNFLGWYLEKEFINQVDNNYLLSKNTKLYAKFAEKPITELLVEFYVQDNLYHSYKTTINSLLTLPTAPVGSGTFKGWYLEKEGINKVDASYSIAKPTKLYALFENSETYDTMTIKSMDKDFLLKKDQASVLVQNGVLFISVEEFLKAAEGIIDYNTKNIVHNQNIDGEDYKIRNYLEYRYLNGVIEIVSVSEYIAVDPNKQNLNDIYKGKMIISPKDNKVTVDNYDFFNTVYAYEEESSGGYKFLVESKNETYEDLSGAELTYDFGKYNQPIMKKNNDVLIPLATLNLLFLHESLYQLVTNNDKIFIINGFSIFDSNEFMKLSEIQNASAYDKEMPQELKQYQYNFMCFALDYYYGIKQENKTYQQVLEKYKNKMINRNNDAHYEANMDIINDLEDLHTWYNPSAPFYDADGNIFNETPKGRKKDHYATQEKIEKIKEKALDISGEYNDYDIRYTSDGKTAIIKFDTFDINEENTNASTPYIIKRKLEEVKSNKPSVKNIILDLSTNIGGVVYTIFEILGLMTDGYVVNNEYIAFANRRTHAEYKSGFTKYDYKFFILSSPVTFSSGNMMVGLCKDNNLATVIGYKTGGGASSTVPIFTPNGMYINISSNSIYTRINYESAEYGIEPDYAFVLQTGSNKYKNLFDLNYIQNFVNGITG